MTAAQLSLFAPARTEYVCPRCHGVTTLGVEFCPTHGWFPRVAPSINQRTP